MDATNVYRWGRLIIENCDFLWLEGNFCFISFFTLFYFTVFYFNYGIKSESDWGQKYPILARVKTFEMKKEPTFLNSIWSQTSLCCNSLIEFSTDDFLKSPWHSGDELQRIPARDKGQTSLMPTSLLSLQESEVLLESRAHSGLIKNVYEIQNTQTSF